MRGRRRVAMVRVLARGRVEWFNFRRQDVKPEVLLGDTVKVIV